MEEARLSTAHTTAPIDPFTRATLAGISLPCRIIRSATHEGLADERGLPTEQLRRRYVAYAKGGVGAIITGYAAVQQDGRCAYHRMLMIDGDDCIPVYQELVSAVHAHQTPIILQIAHCGRQTRSRITGLPTVAPSALRDKFFNEDLPTELSPSAIEQIIQNFVAAMGRAQRAGFDGVQLHVAHGYLLSEFLSPYMNRRRDAWGGSLENRFRILREILTRGRALVGANYPILMKLNAYDGRKGGMRIAEAIEVAKMSEAAGCDAIEVSCGVAEDGLFMSRTATNPLEPLFKFCFKYKQSGALTRFFFKLFADTFVPPPKPRRLYNIEAARQIRAQVKIPIIVVGGIRSRSDIENIVAAGDADFVAMCRPFIMEPAIVRRLRERKQEASRCEDCCYCALAIEEEPLKCYHGKLASGSQDA